MRATHALLRALLLCGAFVPAGLAAQQDPPPPSAAPRQRVKIIRTDSTRDSSVVRLTINADRIEQMIHDLMASKAMEQTIGQSLREASGQPGDAKRMRELSEELGRIAQKNAALITTLEMTCSGDRLPEGYIGVQFSELQTVMGDDSPQIPPMRDYPRIDSVYAASPASKAGVRRGDVVLMLGGQDARRAVQLDKLLRPQAKLAIRVQRDGVAKDLSITVEKRPSDFNSECASVDQLIGPEFDRPMIFMRSPNGARQPWVGTMLPRTPTPPALPDVPATPSIAPMPPAVGYAYGFQTNSAIAGASLMPLSDDWRATLGVDNGVLVTKVLPGTPARDAGLRDGDVITAADGQSITSVRALSRIMSNSKSNAVKLQIVRAGKPQVVVLRWQ